MNEYLFGDGASSSSSSSSEVLRFSDIGILDQALSSALERSGFGRASQVQVKVSE
jgi:hypothetical protein